MLLLSPILAVAGAAISKRPALAPLITEFHLEELEVRADGSLPKGGSWVGHRDPWLTIDQLPPEIRDKPSKSRAIVRLSVDANGQLARCDIVEPQEHPDIARSACLALAARKKFPKTYRAPGQPIPRIWTVALVWETITQSVSDERKAEEARRGPPPRPPMLIRPNDWPPQYPPHALTIDQLPDIRPFVPRRARDGKVGILAKPVTDREEPECTVRQSSGDPVIDEAACQYVRAVRLRYKEPCHVCHNDWWVYPLLIEFNGSKSRVRLPLEKVDYASRQPRLPSLQPSAADVFALSNTLRNRDRVSVFVKVTADGSVTDCRIGISAGSPEADDAICTLVRRQKFIPAHDVFGDSIAADGSVLLNLAGL